MAKLTMIRTSQAARLYIKTQAAKRDIKMDEFVDMLVKAFKQSNNNYQDGGKQ